MMSLFMVSFILFSVPFAGHCLVIPFTVSFNVNCILTYWPPLLSLFFNYVFLTDRKYDGEEAQKLQFRFQWQNLAIREIHLFVIHWRKRWSRARKNYLITICCLVKQGIYFFFHHLFLWQHSWEGRDESFKLLRASKTLIGVGVSQSSCSLFSFFRVLW